MEGEGGRAEPRSVFVLWTHRGSLGASMQEFPYSKQLTMVGTWQGEGARNACRGP